VLWDGVLNATVDDDVDGPSPIEALSAALAGCVARNLVSVVEHAHLAPDGMETRVAAERTDDPPALTLLRLDLGLDAEPAGVLEHPYAHDLAHSLSADR